MRLIIPHELTDLNTYIHAERTNRYIAAKIKKEMTDYVAVLAMCQKCEKFEKPVTIEYHWHCKNKRKDKSNISSAGRKWIEDGLVKAGVLKNDGWNNIEDFRDYWHIDKENPRIEIILREVEA